MLTYLRTTSLVALTAALLAISVNATAQAQQPVITLPEEPSVVLMASANPAEPVYPTLRLDPVAALYAATQDLTSGEIDDPAQQTSTNPQLQDKKPKPATDQDVDANGNVIPLNRQQPKRILGFMPNFRSVSAGAAPHAPGWKYNFKVANHQAFDYSSFVFLFLTSISAEGINEHPKFGKGVGGFYTYAWHGLLDKTDGTYIGAWFLPSLLHEDTRYYAVGNAHSIPYRALYIASRQVVTRTYGGHATPNLAGLGGKVLTQIVSRTYYPTGTTSFGVLAEKFGYSVMRDMAFTAIREFYPDIAAHYKGKHASKVAKMAAKDARAAAAQSTTAPTGPPLPKP